MHRPPEIELLFGRPELVEKIEGAHRHQSGREPGRSILLITTMGLRPSASALVGHEAVWGIGAFDPSTSSSAIDHGKHTRSTSPPKSACPGVSDVDRHVPLYSIAGFFGGW